MKQKRKNYRPDEKAGIIRRHLIDGVQVSDLGSPYKTVRVIKFKGL